MTTNSNSIEGSKNKSAISKMKTVLAPGVAAVTLAAMSFPADASEVTVPEPGTLALFAAGAAGIAYANVRERRRKK